ncbi:MAG TPA: hypothetical protein VFW80_10720 [Gaiellaceae bacterium]|nr:hypothetical protein [Gaiellaceae bacterium]
MKQGRRPGLTEALGVWSFFVLVAIAIVVTYARIPPEELYHTSGRGLEAGASRALVFVGFPFALVAIALAWIAAVRIGARTAAGAAVLATILCITVAFPGVVDQDDLDARPVNALAGVGALLALALLAVAWVREGKGEAVPFGRADYVRIAVAVLLLLVAIPWIGAELGFYVSDAPVLGRIFIAEEIKPSLGGEPSLHAVHLGEHHGFDGVLLALSALALTRVPARMPTRRGATALALYLSLMLAYGLSLALQDGWNEQLVKRGTIDARVPSVIRPVASPAWAGILVGALTIYLLFFRVVESKRPEGVIR